MARDKKVCGIACGGLHNAVWTETVSQTYEMRWEKMQQKNEPNKTDSRQLQDDAGLTDVPDFLMTFTVHLLGSCVYLGLF
jgi:hypothetical protein